MANLTRGFRSKLCASCTDRSKSVLKSAPGRSSASAHVRLADVDHCSPPPPCPDLFRAPRAQPSPVEALVQVVPLRVLRFDQVELPGSRIALDGPLSRDGGRDQLERLPPDQPRAAVAFGETFPRPLSVLVDAAREVRRHASVKRAIASARHDVDGDDLVGVHHARSIAPWMPGTSPGKEEDRTWRALKAAQGRKHVPPPSGNSPHTRDTAVRTPALRMIRVALRHLPLCCALGYPSVQGGSG